MTAERESLQWQLGGVYGQFGFDRPLRANRIMVPSRIEIRGDRLEWFFDSSYDPDGLPYKTVRPGSGLLQGFIELADGAHQKILTYARRWGVLEICEHGRPATHTDFGNPPCVPQKSKGVFWEPLASWQSYGALFRALINIAARVNSGQSGARQDWEIVVNARGLSESPFFRMHGLSVDREKLEIIVNVLVGESRVHPRAIWSKGRWSVQFSGGTVIGCGLFGAIVCQLMLAITQTEGLALCSSCGRGYAPDRRPNQNRRSYCPTCQAQKIPQRDAARDYRARERSSQP